MKKGFGYSVTDTWQDRALRGVATGLLFAVVLPLWAYLSFCWWLERKVKGIIRTNGPDRPLGRIGSDL